MLPITDDQALANILSLSATLAIDPAFEQLENLFFEGAQLTLKNLGSFEDNLDHMVLGLCSEKSELSQAIYASALPTGKSIAGWLHFNTLPNQMVRGGYGAGVCEELGDLFWFSNCTLLLLAPSPDMIKHFPDGRKIRTDGDILRLETAHDLLLNLGLFPQGTAGPVEWALQVLDATVGEIATTAKAFLAYKKPLNVPKMVILVCFVLAVLRWVVHQLTGFPQELVLLDNYFKLNKKRYPQGYSDAAALARADKSA